MSVIASNMSVILLGIMMSAVAWCYGGTIGPYQRTYLPWLVALVLEALFFFPQKHEDESTGAARARAWKGLKRDPITWFAVAFLSLMVIALFNRANCPICDAEAIAGGLPAGAPIKFLPFCFNRAEHWGVMLWFLPAFLGVLVVRHAMTCAGRRLILSIAVWNAAALAFLGILQMATGAKGPFWIPLAGDYRTHFFATFTYANMGAAYFTATFVLALALWYRRGEEIAEDARHHGNRAMSGHKRFWRRHVHLIPALLCIAGAYATLSRAGILLTTAAAVLVFAHAGAAALHRMDRARRVKSAAWCALGLIALGIVGAMFMPEKVAQEISTVNTGAVLNRVTSKGAWHAEAAKHLIGEHPAFGCGGWGYGHLSVKYMPKEDKAYLGYAWMRGLCNVHNDYLQFTVEHGVVGFLLLVATVITLLVPVFKAWSVLLKSVRFAKGKDRPPRPAPLFVLPGSAMAILLGALATFVHGFADCPFRCPSVLILFFVELAAAAGFLPDELPELAGHSSSDSSSSADADFPSTSDKKGN